MGNGKTKFFLLGHKFRLLADYKPVEQLMLNKNLDQQELEDE